MKNFTLESLKGIDENYDEADKKLTLKKKLRVKWDLLDIFTIECSVRVALLSSICYLFYYINSNNAMFNRFFVNSYI